MSTEEFEPITYSNEWFRGKRMFVIAGFLGLLAIGSMITGIYLASLNGDWWVILFFAFFSSPLAYFAYIFYPTEKRVFTDMS